MHNDNHFHLITTMLTQDYDSWTITNDICMLHLEDSADLSSQYIGTIGTPPQSRRKIFANTEKIFVQVCPPAARSTPPATCAPSPAGEPPPREAPSPGSSRRWRKYFQATRKIFMNIQKYFRLTCPWCLTTTAVTPTARTTLPTPWSVPDSTLAARTPAR